MKMKSVKSPLAYILIGIIGAAIICFMLTAVITKMILSQKIGETSVGILSALVILLASMTGAWLSAMLQGNRFVKTVILTIAGILLTVMIAALAVDGPFQGAVKQVIAIMAGGLVSCVICMKKEGGKYKRKSRYR